MDNVLQVAYFQISVRRMTVYFYSLSYSWPLIFLPAVSPVRLQNEDTAISWFRGLVSASTNREKNDRRASVSQAELATCISCLSKLLCKSTRLRLLRNPFLYLSVCLCMGVCVCVCAWYNHDHRSLTKHTLTKHTLTKIAINSSQCK